MPYTPIPPLPAVPDANDGPETFTDDVDQFLGALPTWTDATNAAGVYIDAVGAQVDADKVLAGNSAATAVAAESAALGAANYKGNWAALTGALNMPATVAHNGALWALNVNLANVTTSTPSLTNTNWQYISGTRWQPTRTANFTLAVNAYENVTATSGVVVATLPAFTAQSFFCIFNNPDSTQLVRIAKAGVTVRSAAVTVSGADDITLTPGQLFYAFATNSTNLRVINNG
jgi:hypothetical protein